PYTTLFRSQLNADNSYKPLTGVITGKILFQFFEEIVGDRVVIHGASQRGLEADQVRSAFVGIDIVGKREDLLLVSVVVLHRNLKLDAFAHTFEIDHLVVEQCFVLVKVLDERDDAAGIVKLVLLFRPLVFDGDQYAFVQESQFAQPLGEDIKAEFRCLENVRVRLEIHSCSAAIGMAGHLKRSGGRTSFVALNVDLTATPNLQIHPFGKRIDDRDTNSVQSTGDFV